MTEFEDGRGCRWTAPGEDALHAWQDVVRGYLGASRTTLHRLESLADRAPDMPMVVCTAGYLQKLIGTAATAEQARLTCQRLQALVSRGGTPIERAHAAALDAFCGDRQAEALERLEALLGDHPCEPFALRLAHHLHFYSGRPERMRDSVARVLPLWPTGDVDYGYVLGMYAFALEESGDHDPAERLGREALERNPGDAWAAHAVAHVFEMQQRYEEGLAWMKEAEPLWAEVNRFRFHLYWHGALYELGLGRVEQALDGYDRRVAVDLESGFYLDVCNAASLLLRLELHGVAVGERWSQLADKAEQHIADDQLVFAALHVLIALLFADRPEAAETMLDRFATWSGRSTTQGEVAAECGVELARSLRDYRAGRYERAVRRFQGVHDGLFAIGGSRAQRDVFEMLLISAARRASLDELAAGWIARRRARRPHEHWGISLES